MPSSMLEQHPPPSTVVDRDSSRMRKSVRLKNTSDLPTDMKGERMRSLLRDSRKSPNSSMAQALVTALRFNEQRQRVPIAFRKNREARLEGEWES